MLFNGRLVSVCPFFWHYRYLSVCLPGSRFFVLNMCCVPAGITFKSLIHTWWIWVLVMRYPAVFRVSHVHLYWLASITDEDKQSVQDYPLWLQCYSKFSSPCNFRASILFRQPLCSACYCQDLYLGFLLVLCLVNQWFLGVTEVFLIYIFFLSL